MPARVPQLGYVFKELVGGSKPDLVQAFARALRGADGIIKTTDEEWQRLKPLVHADSDATLNAVMRRYREGIVESWGEQQSARPPRSSTPSSPALAARSSSARATELAPGTFWPSLTF